MATQTQNNVTLTSSEAAAMLGITPGSLAVMRCRGDLPVPYIKVGKRRVMYRLNDIETYLNDRRVVPACCGRA